MTMSVLICLQVANPMQNEPVPNPKFLYFPNRSCTLS